ncbi:unnamed protein product [Oikopleura dioica]|uniref:Uncharacterized protein n=1 Tax=Oikopleura dioica TaxID=34765 RepID=E4XHY5_OIKDI|nr:unnamed protein product [Oikopleura dioica]
MDKNEEQNSNYNDFRRNRKIGWSMEKGNSKRELYGNYSGPPREPRDPNAFEAHYDAYSSRRRNDDLFPRNVQIRDSVVRGKLEINKEISLKTLPGRGARGRSGSRGRGRGNLHAAMNNPRQDWNTAQGILLNEEDGFHEEEPMCPRDPNEFANRKAYHVGGPGEDNKDVGGQYNLESTPSYKEERHTFDYYYWEPPSQENGWVGKDEAKWGVIMKAQYTAVLMKGVFCKIKTIRQTPLYDEDNVTFTYYQWHANPIGDCLFAKDVPITRNYAQVKDFDIFWAKTVDGQNGLFDRLYARGREKLILDDGWTPPPWRGKVWNNHAYTYCSGHALVSTLNRLGIMIQKKKKDGECIEMEFVIYSNTEDGKGKYKLQNTKTSTEPIRESDIIVGVRFRDSWAYMIFIWFCRPLLASTEPMKWASNAEQFCAIWSLVDLHSPTEEKCEFQLTLGTGRIMLTVYNLMMTITYVMRGITKSLSITMQNTIIYIGLFGCNEVFSYESEIMNLFQLTEEGVRKDIQRMTIPYTKEYQRAVGKDFYAHTWRMLFDKNFERNKPEMITMQAAMIKTMDRMVEDQNIGGKGRQSLTTGGIIKAQERAEKDQLDRKVKSFTEENYLNCVGKVPKYQEHFTAQIASSEAYKELHERIKFLEKENRELRKEAASKKRSADEPEYMLEDEKELDFEDTGLPGSKKTRQEKPKNP